MSRATVELTRAQRKALTTLRDTRHDNYEPATGWTYLVGFDCGARTLRALQEAKLVRLGTMPGYACMVLVQITAAGRRALAVAAARAS